MPLKTSQQITKYFDSYGRVDVTFNKHVINMTGLMQNRVYIRVLGTQIPCIVYSSSMEGAKIVANLDDHLFEMIREARNLISLRFCFTREDKSDPISFFVGSKIEGFQPYSKKNPNTNFINLKYTNRPPDDLIEVLGSLLELNANAKKRKEERIIVDDQSMRKLTLKTKSTVIMIENVPRKGILRDLSFSGAKVLIVGVAKFLVGKSVSLKLFFSSTNGPLEIPGQIVRYEEVEGRKDITAIAINFDEGKVPLTYKSIINQFFT